MTNSLGSFRKTQEKWEEIKRMNIIISQMVESEAESVWAKNNGYLGCFSFKVKLREQGKEKESDNETLLTRDDMKERVSGPVWRSIYSGTNSSHKIVARLAFSSSFINSTWLRFGKSCWEHSCATDAVPAVAFRVPHLGKGNHGIFNMRQRMLAEGIPSLVSIRGTTHIDESPYR